MPLRRGLSLWRQIYGDLRPGTSDNPGWPGQAYPGCHGSTIRSRGRPGIRSCPAAIERGFYLSAIAWFAVFAAACAANVR
jgi:hypothetical protein